MTQVIDFETLQALSGLKQPSAIFFDHELPAIEHRPTRGIAKRLWAAEPVPVAAEFWIAGKGKGPTLAGLAPFPMPGGTGLI